MTFIKILKLISMIFCYKLLADLPWSSLVVCKRLTTGSAQQSNNFGIFPFMYNVNFLLFYKRNNLSLGPYTAVELTTILVEPLLMSYLFGSGHIWCFLGFFIKWAIPGLFLFIFVFSNKHCNFYNK